MTGGPSKGGISAAVALALLVNLALLLLAHVPERKALEGDEQYYFELARDRAAGIDRPHDAFWPPLYATLLSSLFRITGPEVLPAQLLQVAMWLAICWIWYRLSLALLGNRHAAFATLGLLLFGADLAPFAHYLWPEILHGALLSGAIALLVLPERTERAAALATQYLSAGVLLGLAVLTKLLLLPLLPVFAVVALRAGGERRWHAAAALVLGLAIPIAPVVVANAQAGQPTFASSGVFNVWLGLNDPPLQTGVPEIAFGEAQRYRASAATPAERNAIYREKVDALVRSRGVVAIATAQFRKQYVRLFDRDTFFVQQLPGGARSAYRFDADALSTLLRGYAYLTHALLLAGAALGLALLPARPLGWPHLFAAFVLYNLGLFLVLHVNPRFLVQLVPFLAFFGGVAVARLTDKPGLGVSAMDPAADVGGRQWLIGSALAALLLYAAFRSSFIG